MSSPENAQQEHVELNDIGSLISENFDKLEAEDQQDEEEVDAQVEVSEEADETTLEAGAEEESEAEVEEGEEPAEELTAEEEIEYNEPAPERWPEELKTVYNDLPPVARKAMLEGIFKPMQQTYTQKTQELAQMRQSIEPMLEALNQYKPDFERMGVNPTEAFRTQIAWASHFAKVGREQGLKDMSAAFGGEQPDQGQPENEYLTPAERKIQAELNELKQSLTGMTQSQQEQAAQAQQQAAAQFQTTLQVECDRFTNEQKDGQPVYPHAEKLAPVMGGLIRGGVVKPFDEYGQAIPLPSLLKQAYDKACSLDPSINTVAAPRQQAKRAQAAQDVSVNTSTSSGVDETLNEPIEDTVAKMFEKLDQKR